MVTTPKSSYTVDVRIIDTGTVLGNIPASVFVNPQIPGFERFDGISYIFLITHMDSNGDPRRILFDLGTHKNWESHFPPQVVEFARKAEGTLIVQEDVADILRREGIMIDSLDALIWSHAHLDHVGDPSIFPSSIPLIVGPGVKRLYSPGYPTVSDSPILETDFANREVKELDFSFSELSIGGLNALDYFGDGSFYLLDAPGHALGHIAGLARTTEETFLLLAGDAYHHASQLRPSTNVPLPEYISIPKCSAQPFHFTMIEKMSPVHSRTEPLLKPGMVSHNVGDAESVLRCLQEFDADENVLIIASHDLSMRPYIDVSPKSANDWKLKGWKQRSRWAFLADFQRPLELIR